MDFLLNPLRLGQLTLQNRVIYSPLAGCSDWPFRKMASRYRPGLMYCEMVKMDALVRFDPNTFHLLDYDPSMHPIGAQLVGGNLDVAFDAAQIIEHLGFDCLDLNCGCPVDKIAKDGSGSALLKEPKKIAKLLEKLVNAVSIPVTVKIRAGWDESSINAPEITRIAEASGAKAIAIHARTRQQAYRGKANWDWIKACKDVANEIIVIGNGDLFDPEAVRAMLDETGSDAALVSRGTMGRPWLAEEILAYAAGEKLPERSLEEHRQALLDHFEYTVAYEPPERAVKHMRKVGCWYIKNEAGTRDFRHRMSRVSTIEEARELIISFQLSTA